MHQLWQLMFLATLLILFSTIIEAFHPIFSSKLLLSTRQHSNQLQIMAKKQESTRLLAARSPTSSGGGATLLDRKVKQVVQSKSALKEEIDKNYRLVLHDDTMHTIPEVCEIVSTVSTLRFN